MLPEEQQNNAFCYKSCFFFFFTAEEKQCLEIEFKGKVKRSQIFFSEDLKVLVCFCVGEECWH